MTHRLSSCLHTSVPVPRVFISILTVTGRTLVSIRLVTNVQLTRKYTTIIIPAPMALTDGKHVMLSYNWKSQKIVSRVHDILKAENIPVWFDIQGGMKDDIYKSMAYGVENAAIVCCFMTPEYQESENCQLELIYAEKQRKRIIACIATDNKDWKPSDWLGLITARLLYIRFRDDSDDGIQHATKELIERIKEHTESHQSVCYAASSADAAVVCECTTEVCTKQCHLRKHHSPKAIPSHPHHAHPYHIHPNTHPHRHPHPQTH